MATAWSLVGVGALPSPNGITNGGFELTAGPWMMSGSAFFSGNGTYPATGAGYAYLGAALGSLVSSGEIAQVFTVPPSGHGLKFALNVTSSDPASKDKLTVEVRSATGTLLTTLATFSVADKAAAGTYATRGPYSLAAYAGQSVRLTFKATGDAAKAMTFRLDDVRLE